MITRVCDSANAQVNPIISPTVTPIAMRNRNVVTPYSMVGCDIVIHSKITAARSMLTASLNTPSISRMLRIRLLTRISCIKGTITVGPVAATSAPNRNAKPQSSPANQCAAIAPPIMVISTPTLTNVSTLRDTVRRCLISMLMLPSKTMITTANVTTSLKPSPYMCGSMTPIHSGPSRIPAASRNTMLGMRTILLSICARILAVRTSVNSAKMYIGSILPEVNPHRIYVAMA